ncbi:MAG TPA: ABC transporter permease [Kineosporiaceae bacterium]|nr:ABC transporter permease [Kineosporiaceae bacterium]
MNATARALVAVVARREILARVRDRTFVISTIFLLVLVAVSTTVPILLTQRGAPEITVAAVGQRATAVADAARSLGAAAEKASSDEAAPDDAQGPAQPGQAPAPAARITVTEVPDDATAQARVRAGTVDAALVPSTGGTGLELVGRREVPSELRSLVAAAAASDALAQRLAASGVSAEQARQALAVAADAAPPERLLEPPSRNTDLALASSTAFAFLFFLTTFLFGMSIAQSVVEEKQSRIVEILVAAVPVRVLLAGKVLGNTALALGQIALFVAVGLAGASVAGQSGLASLLLRSSPWFVLFFLLGFLMLACLWAAAGALANRQEDLQATTVPLQVLVFVPFFAASYVYSPGTLLTTLSYVPFTAPIAMPRRLALGDAAWWEGALSALVVAATAVLLVAVATRIYERSVLRSGGRLGWGAALGLGRDRATATPVPEGA